MVSVQIYRKTHEGSVEIGTLPSCACSIPGTRYVLYGAVFPIVFSYLFGTVRCGYPLIFETAPNRTVGNITKLNRTAP